MSIPFYSDIDLNNNKIINVANPINNTDLANKIYVDTQINDLISDIGIDMQNLQTTLEGEITDEVGQLNTTLSNRITNEVIDLNQAILDNVIDRLNSTSTTNALSANQGYILNDRLTNLENVKNTYSLTTVPIGTYLNNDLYRVVIKETYNTTTDPLNNPVITLTLSDLATNELPINIYGFCVTNDKVLYISHCGYNSQSLPDGISISSYNRITQELGLYIGTTLYGEIIGTGTTLDLFLNIEYTSDSILV